MPKFIKEKLCGLLSAVGCREWPQRWPDMFETIFQIAAMGHKQAELAIIALRLVGEEIMEFNDALSGGRRSDLSQALKVSLPQVLPFVHNFTKTRFDALGAAPRARAAAVDRQPSGRGFGVGVQRGWPSAARRPNGRLD